MIISKKPSKTTRLAPQLAEAETLDRLKFQTQLYLHQHCQKNQINAGAVAREQQNSVQRQLMRLPQIQVNTTAEIRGAETNKAIYLAIISQREQQIKKLVTHFKGMAAVNVDDACFKNIDLVHAKLAQLHPALVLVDSLVAKPAVSEWLRIIRQTDARIKIILLYDEVLPDLIKEIVSYGVSGVIKTDASRELYRKAIWTVHQNELWLPHLLISQIMTLFSPQNPALSINPHIDLPNLTLLTQRELSISEWVAQGLTNKQIAKELEVSPETIKKHLKKIFEKSAVHNRSQLASIYSHSLANGDIR